MPNKRIVLLDCGDTLVDEATEVKEGNSEVVLRAELIPGADTMLRTLAAQGYTLALVADGPVATFRNVLTHYGLWDLFSVKTISETVGVHKPDKKMFLTALNELGVDPADYDKVVMVGNNLERDILGANALGLISVWISWSPRRKRVADVPLEQPDYEIRNPGELPDLLDRIFR